MRVLQPEGWARPVGYANGILAEGKTVFVAGQVAWNERSEVVSDDFSEQARQVLKNIVAILAVAGAGPEHLASMTWFVLDKEEYLRAAKPLGAAYREVIGKHFPAMSVVQVAGLIEEGAKLEIEATAVIPG